MGLTDFPLNNEAFYVKFVEKNILSGRVIFRVSRNLKHRPTRVTCSLAYNILNVDVNCKGLILLPFTQ